MPFFVDGHNLAYAIVPVRRRMTRGDVDGARRDVCALLAGRVEATVFFDGTPRTAAPYPAGVQVVYAGPGRTADDVIVAAVNDAADSGEVTVVTSDRDLRSRCIMAGGAAVGCKKFLEESLGLKPRPAKKRSAAGDDAAAPDKPSGPLSDREIDRWMDYFGLGE
jgi:predicted RNA-binding protein with PIN domain